MLILRANQTFLAASLRFLAQIEACPGIFAVDSQFAAAAAAVTGGSSFGLSVEPAADQDCGSHNDE